MASNQANEESDDLMKETSNPDIIKKESEKERQEQNTATSGKLAINPAIDHSDIVPASSTPSEKKLPSDITGAEAEGEIGTAAAEAGFAGGTHGAGTNSEGRKGNPENYGANQTGPGLATGPMNADTESRAGANE